MASPTCAIGIDIGGTKMALARVDGESALLGRRQLATEAAQGFPRAVERLTAAIRELLAEATPGTKLRGIGIGCAGPVDPGRGLINNPFTLTGWDRCDIVSPLRERFGVPVFLENDADAAALGEAWTGAGRGVDPLVMLTFGTGVGGAAIVGGRILRGTAGEHPEIGHVPVDPSGPPCYCGIRGCLESMASGTALAEAGRPLGFGDARALFAAARAGDSTARGVLDRATQAVTSAAWTIFHTLLPRRLILGGGIMDTEFDRFADAVRAQLARATQFTPSGVEVCRAELGNDAGLVGAAALVFTAVASP